jgi:hypothetical protein
MSSYDYLECEFSSDSSEFEEDYDSTISDSLNIEKDIMNLYNSFLNFKENSNTLILSKLSIEAVKELIYPNYEYVG